MSNTARPGSVNLLTASKAEIAEALKHVADERDFLGRQVVMLRRVLAVLAARHDRGAMLGPDGLLESAALELPPIAKAGLPPLVDVDVIDVGTEGAGRVVVRRTRALGEVGGASAASEDPAAPAGMLALAESVGGGAREEPER